MVPPFGGGNENCTAEDSTLSLQSDTNRGNKTRSRLTRRYLSKRGEESKRRRNYRGTRGKKSVEPTTWTSGTQDTSYIWSATLGCLFARENCKTPPSKVKRASGEAYGLIVSNSCNIEYNISHKTNCQITSPILLRCTLHYQSLGVTSKQHESRARRSEPHFRPHCSYPTTPPLNGHTTAAFSLLANPPPAVSPQSSTSQTVDHTTSPRSLQARDPLRPHLKPTTTQKTTPSPAHLQTKPQRCSSSTPPPAHPSVQTPPYPPEDN